MYEKILCAECRKLVKYHIEETNKQADVWGKSVTYLKRYGVCDECGSEIDVPGLFDENMRRLDEALKCYQN